MISAILFISFFVFLILGLPIAICLGLSSVCAILYSGTSLTIVATNMYSGISKFLLLAIPFFVLSGNIMAKAGISKRLINFVDTCVGHKKGGIAIVCVIVACFFGAISGSGPATVAALGAVLIPAMVEQGGFSAPFSTALMATSSSIADPLPGTEPTVSAEPTPPHPSPTETRPSTRPTPRACWCLTTSPRSFPPSAPRPGAKSPGAWRTKSRTHSRPSSCRPSGWK